MPKNTEQKKPTRRTQVKELPKEEKELTKDEAKKVKGGARGVGVGIVIRGGGKGSVITIDPGFVAL